MTNNNRYKPTPSEEKLLEVLLNPESVGMSITNICKKAGVSRNLYYEATKKEGFNELVKDTSLELLKGKVAHIINATYKNALDPKGHQDRKMLLEMLNIHADKLEHSGGLNLEVKWE